MSDMFYRAFEDRYRGSRDLILARLEAYIPFLNPLKEIDEELYVIDFGCGRGEWLEITKKEGFKPKGIDIDEGMLLSCQENGFDVEKAEGLEYLKLAQTNSCVMVSAFHVVEHISFDALRDFIKEALRVLKPGGVLIMETPNPENIIVATRNFYLDPSHHKPIPSQLLSFVAEYTGFKRVKTIRLQESKELVSKENVNLSEVFSGASPDYAIVAQKDAANEVLKKFDNAFTYEYGLSLDVLLARWDNRFDKVEQQIKQAEAKANKAEAEINYLKSELREMQTDWRWKILRYFRKST